MQFILLLLIFLISLGLKDFEHSEAKPSNDLKRHYRPPLYHLTPVKPQDAPQVETEAPPVPSESSAGVPPPVGGEIEIPPGPSDEGVTPVPLPKLSPVEYPQDKMPPETLPYQGMYPKIERRIPKELQDEGNFMTQPMPQRNPGPSAVFPGRPRHTIPRIP